MKGTDYSDEEIHRETTVKNLIIWGRKKDT